MLQRMRELAVQAANGTNSTSDRDTLQAEMNQLLAEVDGVSKSASYNGINLLDGSAKLVTLQTGAKAGDTMTFGITGYFGEVARLQGYRVDGQLTTGRVGDPAVLAVDDVLINGKAAFASVRPPPRRPRSPPRSTATPAFTGTKATAYNTLTGTLPNSRPSARVISRSTTATIVAAGSVEELVANINRDAAGVTAVLNDDGTIGLSNDTGNNIVIGGTSAAHDRQGRSSPAAPIRASWRSRA
jgi:flagellin